MFCPPFPDQKKAAVVFSIDDLHPARSEDGYEAGGDLERGVLGALHRLLVSSKKLKCTAFVTADWREISPFPTRRLLSALPWVKNHFYLGKRWPEGKMRLDHHPEFIDFLKSLPRTEIAGHGLEHYAKGPNPFKEFENLSAQECSARLEKMEQIFESAGLEKPLGFSPPGWAITASLTQVLDQRGYVYVNTARDLNTPIHKESVTQESGLRGVPLLFPCFFQKTSLVHVPCNWSATSDIARAEKIIEAGGVLSVKAHAIEKMLNHTSRDALNESYVKSLSHLFKHLEAQYGDKIWWASFGELAAWYRKAALAESFR